MPISLTAANTEIIQRNSVTIETHDSAAVISDQADLVANVLTFVLAYGTPATNSFLSGPRPGPQTAPITVTLNLGTGAWQATNNTYGTLGGAALTTINTNVRNLRNALETITNGQSIVTGSVVAWT
jgi:hypothetical protein